MAVHNKKLITKKFPQGNKTGFAAGERLTQRAITTARIAGKSTGLKTQRAITAAKIAGKAFKPREVLSRTGFASALLRNPLAKKIPYVGTPLTVLSIAQKVKKIVSPKFPGSPKLPIGKKNFSYWKDFQVPIPKANTVSYSGKLNKGTRDFTGLLEKISKTPNKVLLKRLNKNKL